MEYECCSIWKARCVGPEQSRVTIIQADCTEPPQHCPSGHALVPNTLTLSERRPMRMALDHQVMVRPQWRVWCRQDNRFVISRHPDVCGDDPNHPIDPLYTVAVADKAATQCDIRHFQFPTLHQTRLKTTWQKLGCFQLAPHTNSTFVSINAICQALHPVTTTSNTRIAIRIYHAPQNTVLMEASHIWDLGATVQPQTFTLSSDVCDANWTAPENGAIIELQAQTSDVAVNDWFRIESVAIDVLEEQQQ